MWGWDFVFCIFLIGLMGFVELICCLLIEVSYYVDMMVIGDGDSVDVNVVVFIVYYDGFVFCIVDVIFILLDGDCVSGYV